MKRKRKNPMKRKRTSSSKQQTVASYYLPDECWESIFKFIMDDHNDDDDDDCSNNNNHYLSSLSLVSKQFLSITNRLLFSLTVNKDSICYPIFKRFTNLNSLKLIDNLDVLLPKISSFPLKLTSLNLSHHTIPATGLRVFSQKITTLTSLSYSYIRSLNASDLSLIAECFPLLQEINLSYPKGCENYSSYVDGIEALSLALIKLRKVNLSGFPINDQSLFHLFCNCKHLEEVILFDCCEITDQGFAFALRERPTLKSLSFSIANPDDKKVFSHLIHSLVSLKGLTRLFLSDLNISDELLYSIAREGLPLTSLKLQCCTNYSYNGIFYMLSKCQRIKYLDLQDASFLDDEHVVELSAFLRDLVSINLTWCDKLTKSALFTLARNCPSLSEIKMKEIEIESEINLVRNSDSLLEFGVYPQLKSLYLGSNSWLSDEILIMVASIFPNLQLLDLGSCNNISEGIFPVLRKCCKIRHLNLAYCSRVKLLGMNFVVPKLEVLNLSYTNVDDETLYVISKNCPGLLQLLLEHCDGTVTEKTVKYVAENCTKLREINLRGVHFTDKKSAEISCHGCRIVKTVKKYYAEI